MLNMDFTVDLSVWQDGITFHSDHVQSIKAGEPRPEKRPSFAQQLKEAPVSESREKTLPQKNAAASAVLLAQEPKVQELPASLKDAVDLTPFIVSADSVSKPGLRSYFVALHQQVLDGL